MLEASHSIHDRRAFGRVQLVAAANPATNQSSEWFVLAAGTDLGSSAIMWRAGLQL
jgi:hypothetical protein